MLSNRKTSRFYSVKGFAFTAIALALLMSVTAFASGNSRFAFIDSATEFFGLQGSDATVVTAQPVNSTQTAPASARSAIVDVAVSLPAATLATTGSTISLPITIGDVTGLGVISYDMNVDFDPAVMVPAATAFTAAGTLSSAMSVTPNTNNAGHFIISAFQGNPVVGGGTLLFLNFTVVGGSASTTNINFAFYTDPGNADHASFVFNEGDPNAAPLTGGTVSVPAATPTNTATSTNTNTPTPSATNTATSTSTSTPTSTNTNTPTPSATNTATSTSTATFTPTPVTNTQPGPNSTPFGPGVPSNASVSFSNVSVAGYTTFTPIAQPAASGGYNICPTCPAYDITTTAVYTPPVRVCLSVPSSISPGAFSTMALQHSGAPVLPAILVGLPTDSTRSVCGDVTSLSPFSIIMTTAACLNVHIDNVITVSGAPTPVPVTVPVRVDEDLTGKEVYSIDTHISYDPSIMTLAGSGPGLTHGISLGAVGNSNPTASCPGRIVTVSELTLGTLEISVHGCAPMTGSGIMFNLNFTNAVGPAGLYTPVSFTPGGINLADGFKFNEDDPCSDPTNGSVRILGGHVDGRVTYGNAVVGPPIRGVGNVTIAAQPDSASDPTGSAVTNPSGTYLFSSLFGSGAYTFTPSKPRALPSDLNNNLGGAISAFDAARVARHVVDLQPLNARQLIVADVTSDSTISSFDSAYIARHVVGLPDNPGARTGSWIFLPPSRYHISVAFIANDDYEALLYGDVTGNYDTDTTSILGGRMASGPEKAMAITLPNLVTPVGSNVVLPITVPNTTDKGIVAYQFDLHYDPSVIQPQANPVGLAGTLSSNLTVVTNATTPGVLRVAVYGPMPIDGSGVLMNVRFTAVGNVYAISPVSLENFIFNEGVIKTQTVDGRIELSPVYNTATAD